MTTVEDVIRIFGQPPSPEQAAADIRRLADRIIHADANQPRWEPSWELDYPGPDGVEEDGIETEAPEPGSWRKQGF